MKFLVGALSSPNLIELILCYVLHAKWTIDIANASVMGCVTKTNDEVKSLINQALFPGLDLERARGPEAHILASGPAILADCGPGWPALI